MADIDVRYITEALNGKIDMPNGASQGSVDFVVAYKTPTESDPTWYRVYKSGWVEQGGFVQPNGATFLEITLPKKMKDKNYTGIVTACGTDNDTGGWDTLQSVLCGGTTYVYGKKEDAIRISCTSVCGTNWEVKGQIYPTELQRILGGN